MNLNEKKNYFSFIIHEVKIIYEMSSPRPFYVDKKRIKKNAKEISDSYFGLLRIIFFILCIIYMFISYIKSFYISNNISFFSFIV